MTQPTPCRALDGAPQVTLTLDGQEIQAPAQGSVAAAMLANGLHATRTTALSGAPRAPYCMMGVCFECLVEIDGRPNRQACLEMVRPGMQVRTQRGARPFPTAPRSEQEARDAG